MKKREVILDALEYNGMLLQWFLFTYCVAIALGGECSKPLGMEDGTIKDEQLNASHWLYFKTGSSDHYSGKLARLNVKSPLGGGWCSEDNSEYKNQYIEIDLLINKKLTGLSTQGRAGTSAEYVQFYQITYQRDGEDFFRTYNTSGAWKEFKGNEDSSTVVKHTFEKSFIARRIRLYPRGEEFTIYCLRMELYGCKWAHSASGLFQYNAPLGGERQGVDMRDLPYDGVVTTDRVEKGLGKLTDDVYGVKSLVGSQGSPWVAYNVEKPELNFKFSAKRLLKKVLIHVNNNGKDIQIFDSVEIHVSSDDVKYTLLTTYKPIREQRQHIDAFAVIIKLDSDVVARYIRLKFKKQSTWLLLSEVVFMSDSYPPKQVIPVETVSKPPIKIFTSVPAVVTTKRKNEVAPKAEQESAKSLSFPVILTIALVTIVLAAVVSIFIYKSYNKKKKKNTPPRNITPTKQQHFESPSSKQEMALLHEEHLLAMQERQNTLLHNGMYMQPNMPVNPYNVPPSVVQANQYDTQQPAQAKVYDTHVVVGV